MLKLSKPRLHWLSLLRSVFVPENSLHFLNQSGEKRKPITTWSPAFSRALGSLLSFTLSFHCLIIMLTIMFPFFLLNWFKNLRWSLSQLHAN